MYASKPGYCMQVQQIEHDASICLFLPFCLVHLFADIVSTVREQTKRLMKMCVYTLFYRYCKRTSSIRHQRSVSAVKAQCTQWKRREGAVKAQRTQWKRRESADSRQQELRRNAIERHRSSVATPWSL